MSKLICSKDVDKCHAAGKMVCYIEHGTIITPSAKDQASKYGMELVEGCEPSCENGACSAPAAAMESLGNASSAELLALLRKVLTGDVQIPTTSSAPFQADIHKNGLKVVNGKSVVMDKFDTGTPNAVVGFQELVGKDESQMSAGFLTIDHSKFAWKLTYEEIDYVIEGTVTVEIDGKTYTGHAGDVLFVPSGSDVIWGSPDKAKIFYATYPSNWPDLM